MLFFLARVWGHRDAKLMLWRKASVSCIRQPQFAGDTQSHQTVDAHSQVSHFQNSFSSSTCFSAGTPEFTLGMTLECLGGVFGFFFVLVLLVWFVVWGFYQILTKIVALVKLSQPHRLTEEIYNKLANGEP